MLDRLSGFLARDHNLANLEQIESILDQLGQAAFLIDLSKKRILAANARAVEITARTRLELSVLELAAVFGGPEALAKNTTGGKTIRSAILPRLGEPIDVELSIAPVGVKSSWIIIQCEPSAEQKRREAEAALQENLWEGLQLLTLSTQAADLQQAIRGAFAAGERLIQANTLVIYQLQAHEPGLVRFASNRREHPLPDELEIDDLGPLQERLLWTPRTRASSALHRHARDAGFRYLLTLPLGEPGALPGLLAIGDDAQDPPDHLLPLSQILADSITTSLQKNVLTTNLQDKLHHQNIEIALSTSMKDLVEDGLIVLTPQLKIKELNTAAQLLLGYVNQEVEREPVHKILIGTSTLIPALISAQDGIASPNLGEVRLHRRNGEAFRAHVRTAPVVIKERVESILVLFRDLSEREQFRSQTQQLEQRALLGEVTAVFAHEVLNPINNINSGLDLLTIRLKEDEQNWAVVQRIKEDCDRLEHLMEGVKDFSRSANYRMEPVQLQSLVEHLFERWRPRMARVNIQHSLHIEPDTPAVEGDRMALEQVFTNLISNAVNAMKEAGGSLAIKAYPSRRDLERPRVNISVSDTGPGMSDQVKENIFKPFYTTDREGTGLGLAITKRIITAHKGTILVNSVPGGTAFQIQLPAAESREL